PELKLKLIADVVAANPAKSDRAIASEIGVDHKTVAKARKSTGEASPVAKRVGKDGKARKLPAQKPKTIALNVVQVPATPQTIELKITKGPTAYDSPEASAEQRKSEYAAAEPASEPIVAETKPKSIAGHVDFLLRRIDEWARANLRDRTEGDRFFRNLKDRIDQVHLAWVKNLPATEEATDDGSIPPFLLRTQQGAPA